MCGRFAITLPDDAMARLFRAQPANDLPPVPNLNVRPTDPIHVVRLGATGRQLCQMRWGFVPHWARALNDGPLLINARAETLAEKPAFRAAARTRRCLIPASWFYEWTGEKGAKQPWKIAATDGAPLALAGLWQDWGEGETRLATCAIVTCAANATLAPIHHRMPVVLGAGDWPLWLGEAGHGAARLMRPAAEARLTPGETDLV
ncbi:SOS response-associated peptidase [Roseovarius sp. C7]|uniref:SOS response-associated peptidase n=1 Tax=Roseovarius sp. C7 TaxID=3398643 RepID=UPI0039F6780A